MVSTGFGSWGQGAGGSILDLKLRFQLRFLPCNVGELSDVRELPDPLGTLCS